MSTEIKFSLGTCEYCGSKNVQLMISNNPLVNSHICFHCLAEKLSYSNLNQIDFFCRTFNLPFLPDLWTKLSAQYKEDTFRQYTLLVLSDESNQPNLAYSSSTKDLWDRVNKEWEKNRSFYSIMNKIENIKEGYIERSRAKWGDQYSFEELLELDSIYVKTLRANNIINPLQKAAIKNLCRLQIEIEDAIKTKDAKIMKDLSTAYTNFAKQADLETMINETKTEDITTMADYSNYLEQCGFQPTFYDGIDRDEIDKAIKDIQEANRKVVLESTGLQSQLEEMIRKRTEEEEERRSALATKETSLDDLLHFNSEDTEEVATEDDTEAENLNFDEEENEKDAATLDTSQQITIKRKE